MLEQIDPADPTRLTPSCSTPSGDAFPPRRLVMVAQNFGPNALVRSICRDDYQSAFGVLAEKIHDHVDMMEP